MPVESSHWAGISPTTECE